MNEKSFKKWEKRRSRGALRFIVPFGLGWTLLVCIIDLLLAALFRVFLDQGFVPKMNFALAIPLLVGGQLWSTIMWIFFEYKFRNAVQNGTLNIVTSASSAFNETSSTDR